MQEAWSKLTQSVLRPARPALARCLAERERHLEARRAFAEARARALADCEARIEGARAEIFAAHDGVVGASMGELEREWRRLSRIDPEQGMMDLWSRVAPLSWIDRKRWRGSDRPVDAATALAADVEGVEAAEAAALRLRSALAPWGVALGTRVLWNISDTHSADVADLLARPLAAARAKLATRDRVQPVEGLPLPLGHAAYVDYVWRAAKLEGPNPTTPLFDLWKTGYVLAAADDRAITLGCPALA